MDRRNHKAGKGGVFFRRYLVFDPTMSFRGRSIDLRVEDFGCAVLFCFVCLCDPCQTNLHTLDTRESAMAV